VAVAGGSVGAGSVAAAGSVELAVGVGADVSSALSLVQALKARANSKLNITNNARLRDLKNKLYMANPLLETLFLPLTGALYPYKWARGPAKRWVFSPPFDGDPFPFVEAPQTARRPVCRLW
jgi:hypothetical protein